MAEVFLARQAGAGGFERLIVVKRILPHLGDDQEAAELLRREARLCALLSHPNVVHLYDFDELDGSGFLVMEPVDGPSLAAILRRSGPVPADIAAYIAAEAANGLHAAHDLRDSTGRPLKLVHRDVSPENLLISWTGQVKVADFGIAISSLAPRLTRAGTIRGKPVYMAPEQLKGLPLDQRADVYSLGAVLYEMLGGRPPYVGETEVGTMAAVLNADLPPLPTAIPLALIAETRRALSRDIGERHPTALHFGYRVRAAARSGSASLLASWLDGFFPENDPARSRFKNAVGRGPAPVRAGTRRLEAVATEATAQAVAFAPDKATGAPSTDELEVARIAGRRTRRTLALSIAVLSVGLASAGAYAWLNAGGPPNATEPPAARATVAAPPTRMEEPPQKIAGASPVVVAPSQAPEPTRSSPAVDEPEVSRNSDRLEPLLPKTLRRSPKAPIAPAPINSIPPPPLAVAVAGATLNLRSDPPCDLIVDGTLVGHGQGTVPELAAGIHEVQCRDAVKAIDLSMEVNLAAGEKRAVEIIPGKGVLEIKVAPWGRIFLDGKDLGLNPIVPQTVYEGRHHVEAQRPGKHAEQMVIVPRDETVEVKLRLD